MTTLHGKPAKKLEKQLQRGDLTRLKYYMRKYKIHVNSRLDKDQTLLHLACKEGQGHIIRYLLKKGADVGLQNNEGCLPLHVALKKVIYGHNHAYEELVKPLLADSSCFLDLPDKSGTTPRDLLDTLAKCAEAATDTEGSDSSSSEDNDYKWNQKLANEMYDEGASFDKYGADYMYESDPETSDRWNERIRKEYNNKHYHRAPSRKRHKGSKVNNSGLTDEEKAAFQKRLEQEHQEYLKKQEIAKLFKQREEKVTYELKWKRLLKVDNKNELRYENIPWPGECEDVDKLESWFFCDIDNNSTSEMKKYLRDQQIRWHPDKFVQKLGQKLHIEDKQKILEKVKEISQLVNTLSDKMS